MFFRTKLLLFPTPVSSFSRLSCNLSTKHVQISNMGRKRSKYGLITTPKPRRDDYSQIYINKTNYLVHVLVCSLFHGPRPSPEHTVHHIDKNPCNNCAENLMWATRLEQRIFQNRPSGCGGKKKSKAVIAKRIDCEEEVTFPSINDARKKLNVNVGGISQCCHGLMKQLKGYTFRFDKDAMEPDLLPGELWRKVPGSVAEVSNFGRFRSTWG